MQGFIKNGEKITFPLILGMNAIIMRHVMFDGVRVIAAFTYCDCRGKSMLAQAEMRVVFVPSEKIS